VSPPHTHLLRINLVHICDAVAVLIQLIVLLEGLPGSLEEGTNAGQGKSQTVYKGKGFSSCTNQLAVLLGGLTREPSPQCRAGLEFDCVRV